ncbi:MAG: hypothetical protein AAGI38_13075 [Bacteroidota bacterium]
MQAELLHTPILAALQGQNPFEVPDGYFETFPESIQEQLGPMSLPEQKVQQSSAPYGYFNRLPDLIMDRIEAEELAAKAPNLMKLQQTTPFKAPAGYFDELPARVSTQLPSATATAKLRPLFRNPGRLSVAIAAAFALLLICFQWWMGPSQQDDTQQAAQELARSLEEVSEDELLAFLGLEEGELVQLAGEYDLNVASEALIPELNEVDAAPYLPEYDEVDWGEIY